MLDSLMLVVMFVLAVAFLMPRCAWKRLQASSQTLVDQDLFVPI